MISSGSGHVAFSLHWALDPRIKTRTVPVSMPERNRFLVQPPRPALLPLPEILDGAPLAKEYVRRVCCLRRFDRPNALPASISSHGLILFTVSHRTLATMHLPAAGWLGVHHVTLCCLYGDDTSSLPANAPSDDDHE